MKLSQVITARMLRMRGRRDARKGERVVSSTICAMLASQSAREYALAQQAEARTHPIRLSAVKALAGRDASLRQLRELPEPPGSSAPADIRRARERTHRLSEASSRLKATTVTLSELHEQLIRENSELLNLIHQSRQQAMTRILAYLSGVHETEAMSTYEYGEFFQGHPAYALYLDQHWELDEAIAAQAARNSEKEAA